MRKSTPGLAFALFLLLGSPFFSMSPEVYAACSNRCMCGWGCYQGCTCPGTGGCPYCAASGSEYLQVNAPPTEETMAVTAVLDPAPSNAINSYSLDRLIRRAGTGQCAQNNFRLNIMDGETPLKLDEALLKDYSMPDSSVAFQLAINGEK